MLAVVCVTGAHPATAGRRRFTVASSRASCGTKLCRCQHEGSCITPHKVLLVFLCRLSLPFTREVDASYCMLRYRCRALAKPRPSVLSFTTPVVFLYDTGRWMCSFRS